MAVIFGIAGVLLVLGAGVGIMIYNDHRERRQLREILE